MKLLITSFVLVALAQLFVPAKMILDKESVLRNGRELKFRTAPVDPYDYFRGKYIVLSYDEKTLSAESELNWAHNEPVYVLFKEDKEGFATIESLSKQKPKNTEFYLKTTVRYVSHANDSRKKKVFVKFDFNRFYMEESKAYNAELAYNRSMSIEHSITYAIVCVKDGEATLKDVHIDAKAIQEVAEEMDQHEH